MINRDEALALLKKYNQEEFHIHHGITLECVMRYLAKKHGYGEDAEFWAICGLLHDIDFEMWPSEHCKKAPELLREAGVDEAIIHAVVSHGYGLCSDVKPEHEMEKILFAADTAFGLSCRCHALFLGDQWKPDDLSSLRLLSSGILLKKTCRRLS